MKVQKIIVRGKLPLGIIFFLSILMFTAPAVFLTARQAWNYYQALAEINELLTERNQPQQNAKALALIAALMRSGRYSKTLLALRFEFLLEKQPKNFYSLTEALALGRYLFNLSTPKKQKTLMVTLGKLYYDLGPLYYSQAKHFLTQYEKTLLRQYRAEEREVLEMRYAIHKTLLEPERALFYITQLVALFPNEVHFRLQTAEANIALQQHLTAKKVLEDYIFSTTFKYETKHRALLLLLIAVNKELALYEKMEFYYLYLLEKHPEDGALRKSFLEDRKQFKQAPLPQKRSSSSSLSVSYFNPASP